MKLTDAQQSLLQTALRCAAEVFDKDAAECKNEPSQPRLVEQFTKQAKETRELADLFNTADSIEVSFE